VFYRTGVRLNHCRASSKPLNTLKGLLGSMFCLSSTAISSAKGDMPTTIATGPALPSAPNCISACDDIISLNLKNRVRKIEELSITLCPHGGHRQQVLLDERAINDASAADHNCQRLGLDLSDSG
jgi:hypothetical protein